MPVPGAEAGAEAGVRPAMSSSDAKSRQSTLVMSTPQPGSGGIQSGAADLGICWRFSESSSCPMREEDNREKRKNKRDHKKNQERIRKRGREGGREGQGEGERGKTKKRFVVHKQAANPLFTRERAANRCAREAHAQHVSR